MAPTCSSTFPQLEPDVCDMSSMEDLERKKRSIGLIQITNGNRLFGSFWQLSSDSKWFEYASNGFNFSFLMVFLIFSQAADDFSHEGNRWLFHAPENFKGRVPSAADQPGDPEETRRSTRRSVKQLVSYLSKHQKKSLTLVFHICIPYMYSIWYSICL